MKFFLIVVFSLSASFCFSQKNNADNGLVNKVNIVLELMKSKSSFDSLKGKEIKTQRPGGPSFLFDIKYVSKYHISNKTEAYLEDVKGFDNNTYKQYNEVLFDSKKESDTNAQWEIVKNELEKLGETNFTSKTDNSYKIFKMTGKNVFFGYQIELSTNQSADYKRHELAITISNYY